MDFVRKNPVLVGGIAILAAGFAYWMYTKHQEKKKEHFMQANKARLQKAVNVLKKMGKTAYNHRDEIISAASDIAEIGVKLLGAYGDYKEKMIVPSSEWTYL